MWYNVYKNIDEPTYLNLETRIVNILPECIDIMNSNNFEINKDYLNGDILGLDFLSANDNYYGTVGFLFDDIDSSHTFSFYTLKARDEGKRRYYKSEIVYERVTMETIERNYKVMLLKCIAEHNKLTDADLTEYVNLRSAE